MTLTLGEKSQRGQMPVADCVLFPKNPPPPSKGVTVQLLLCAFSTSPQGRAESFLAALPAVALGLTLVSAMGLNGTSATSEQKLFVDCRIQCVSLLLTIKIEH